MWKALIRYEAVLSCVAISCLYDRPFPLPSHALFKIYKQCLNQLEHRRSTDVAPA